ncbi:MAG TPA: efflux RND transporter periplasmic adaptor subunit [Syntrophales bacterium]|nr:efflux RND transporter periplasmic adaptor subunit [Syntrophales bacterium]
MLKILEKRSVRIAFLAVICLAVVGSVGTWLYYTKLEKKAAFRTAPIRRSDLIATISASGTVEPEVVVDVGAQIAGIIIDFGKDASGKTIDYGSVVEKDMVLAKIDDSLYAAAVETAKAQLQQAHANKTSADANVLQQKAKLLQAKQDWDRARKLGPSDALSKSAYDQYEANYEVAKANVAAAEAAVEQTKAAVAQARASLASARINLGYCIIKSPVKGIIIDRRVNIGQTVVSSLSAPSLFLIAKDLKRVQIWVSVNEADVGSICEGQPVTFTVDAYPDQIFQGQVGKIRLNATMTQNVVTYTVEVNTNNDDGKLLPYLTANIQFKIGRRQSVLVVPNAALRWSPRSDQIDPEIRKIAHGAATSSIPDNKGADVAGLLQSRGTVWIEQHNFVRPVHVKIGLTDGTVTEIEGDSLKEGLRVVVGEAERETAAASTAERSPFTPQIGRGPRQGQSNQSGGPGAQTGER